MKKLQVSFFMALALLLMSMVALVNASTMDEIVKRGELRVAVQAQGPPFSFIDKNGERTGSSVEICKMMAEEMGVEIKFLDFDWDGLIPALLTGKADILAADMTPTFKRALKVSFTDPFYISTQIMYVRTDSKYKSIEELNNSEVTIAGLLGSVYTKTAEKILPNAKIKMFKGGGNIAMSAVMNGNADVSVVDRSNYHALASNYPPGMFRMFPRKLSYDPLAFAIKPADRHLLEWVNLFFVWIKADGRYEKNMNYWVNSTDWKKDH
ncbi:MAG: transporter substrate-binding domain-containing protein [Desulfotalea sp.]